MRAVSVATIALLLASACVPAPKAGDPDAGGPQSGTAPVPPIAMGKRAPPQPGEQVSPVIAFRGHAEHWSIQIENAGGYAHAVDFTWSSGSEHATGTLQYRPTPGTAEAAPVLLEGSLDTDAGRRAMRVRITPAACTDDADRVFPHQLQVTVEGMGPMHGCGELAK